MALGIDDSPVTTCATVAFGTKTPVVVAPAMHEAMLEHPVVMQHAGLLAQKLGVTWVEPVHEEKKAKLADVEAIVEAVIHRLATDAKAPGPLAGKKALVVSGSTAEPLDPVRVITNRSSGRSGHLIATELARLGAEVTLWDGHTSDPLPSHLEAHTKSFSTHADLMRLAGSAKGFDQVWMPAAIGDYATVPSKAKIASEQKVLTLQLKPLGKVVEVLRKKMPKATLVAFKAESDTKGLLAAAQDRLKRYKAQFVVANLATAFGADDTTVHLVFPGGHETLSGPKDQVLPTLVGLVALAGSDGKPRKKGKK
jgi:phosphopantothenoylcysteine decarboxylase/phosphopantothenate--cysteine ligase